MATNTNFLVANAMASHTAADADIARVPDAVYVAGAGTLVCTDLEGTVTTVTMVAGGLLHARVVRIAAASSATGIVLLYEHGIV